MPRSGSTLTESIISMNSRVFDLGEINVKDLIKNGKKSRKS